MSDTVSLNEARATKHNDSTLWTPLDMARALVRDIENGTIRPERIIVHYIEEADAQGARHTGYKVAQCSFDQHLALLTLATHTTVDRYRCG